MTARASALAMVGAAVCFGTIEWVAAQLHDGLSAVQVVWTRYAIQLLAIGAVAAWRRSNPFRTRQLGPQILRSLLMVGMPAAYVTAAQLAPSRNVWAVFWITPLLTMWAGKRWTRERIDGRLWGLAAVALVGVLAIVRPSPYMRWEAAAAAAVMAACFSGYLVLTRVLHAQTTLSRLFYTAFGVFVVLTPFLPQVFRPPTSHDWAVLSTIGLLGLACLWCIDVALDAQPAARMAPFLYVTPAFFVILSAMAGARSLGRSAWVGIALLLITLWAGWPGRLPGERLQGARS